MLVLGGQENGKDRPSALAGRNTDTIQFGQIPYNYIYIYINYISYFCGLLALLIRNNEWNPIALHFKFAAGIAQYQ